MGNDFTRIKFTVFNFFVQHRHQMNNRCLSHLHRHVAFEHIAEWEHIVRKTVDTGQLDNAEFADGIFGNIDGTKCSALQLQFLLDCFSFFWTASAVDFLPSIPTQSITTRAPPLVIS